MQVQVAQAAQAVQHRWIQLLQDAGMEVQGGQAREPLQRVGAGHRGGQLAEGAGRQRRYSITAQQGLGRGGVARRQQQPGDREGGQERRQQVHVLLWC